MRHSMRSRADRRADAIDRDKLHAKRSVADQLALIAGRPGNSARETAKLEKIAAKDES